MQATHDNIDSDAGSGWDAFQINFHRRWNHLVDPHVRALAWLLDSPDLLDPQASQWQGKIASLHGAVDQAVLDWLAELDRVPQALHVQLNGRHGTRLGRYAEDLMAAYFRWQGTLVAHGLQVRADKSDTIGEFDFLLHNGGSKGNSSGNGLAHWEFATKFYLLAPAKDDGQGADYLVGPNLADTLGAKIRKILERQLSLAQHPAAQRHLPEPVTSAQALVKGWLFYHGADDKAQQHSNTRGVSLGHCRGFWRALAEFDTVDGELFVILPRLKWLAPAKVLFQDVLDKDGLRDALRVHFASDTMPVLVAALQKRGDWMVETSRGFIVPDDWSTRARLSLSASPPL